MFSFLSGLYSAWDVHSPLTKFPDHVPSAKSAPGGPAVTSRAPRFIHRICRDGYVYCVSPPLHGTCLESRDAVAGRFPVPNAYL